MNRQPVVFDFLITYPIHVFKSLENRQLSFRNEILSLSYNNNAKQDNYLNEIRFFF
jgi:hypothetical protein